MNHVCLLNKKTDEYNCLLRGKETMIVRGSKLRMAPYEHVFPGDGIYFTDKRNKIVLRAYVEDVDNIAVKSKRQVREIVKENEDRLIINRRTYRKLRKNSFIVLIRLLDVQKAEHPEVYDNIFSCSDTWVLAGNMSYQ